MTSPWVWWKSLSPATREPIKSAVVSVGFGLGTAVGTLFGAYFADHDAKVASDWGGFFWYLLSPHSVGAITIAIAAVYRARQGAVRVANTVDLPGGATAVITPPGGKP